MKNYFFLLLLTSVSIYSQTKTMKINYEFKIDLGNENKYKSVLYVNDAESIFIWNKPISNVKDVSEDGSHVKINLNKSDSIGSFNYRNYKTDTLYSRSPFFNGDAIILKEKNPEIEWSILSENKKINNWDCQKAKATFRGREYIVWFTYDIPIRSGPWKLNGLPGLIVYAHDTSNAIEFTLKSVTNSAYQINAPLEEGTEVSLDEYVDISKSYVDNFVKKLKSKLPRGANVKVDHIRGIELFE